MNEVQVLELMLWVFGVAFAIKSVVFGILAKTMWPPARGLSRALLLHYASISIQAVFLCLIYFMYVSLLHGGGPDAPERIALYIVSIPAVIAVDLSGIYLIYKYFQDERKRESAASKSREELAELRDGLP